MTIEELITRHMERLSPSEKKIGRYIMNNNINLSTHTITQASKICGVSPSLINKFCIKIGASGWKTLKGLSFIELRTSRKDKREVFNENYILLENTFIVNKEYIEKFIFKLYNKMYSSKKTVIFANGTTKHVAELVMFKWNKLGGNVTIYDFTESYVSIDYDATIIFISISGTNRKISYYQEQSKNTNQFLITLGSNHTFKGERLSLSVYEQFDKTEKAFPVITDVFLHLLLNKIVELKLEDAQIIKKRIRKIKSKDI